MKTCSMNSFTKIILIYGALVGMIALHVMGYL